MKATCPSCNANLNIADKKIPAGGARIKCPTCQNIFPVKPGAGAAGASAVPLPGSSPTPKDSEWEDAPTRMAPAYIPPEAVPGATTAKAPPSNVHEVQTRKMPANKPAGGAV